MSVSKEVQEFINNSLAQNNRALLDHISKLVAADDQLREIKKLRREEPKVFKRKGNTNSIPSFRIRWMMSNCISRPTHSTRLNRPCQKVHVIAHRKAKAIPFSMHINQISVGRPLRNIPSMNLLMMRRIAKEERAEKTLKSAAAKTSKRSSSAPRRSTSSQSHAEFQELLVVWLLA